MRAVLIGAGSFIARHVGRAAADVGLEVATLPHDADLDELLPGADVAINFALHPDFQRQIYAEETDFDLRAARAAKKNNTNFVMLSTRRVYPEAVRWGAKENGRFGGDETVYGQNKAESEIRVRASGVQKLTILRLSNVIGFEYEPDRQRRTFMGILLASLHDDQKIYFNMSAETRRDFLPVEICARAIVRCLLTTATGIFNLGSGFGITCGEIATAVLKGHGSGRLIVTNDEKRDCFYLDMERWNSRFEPLVTKSDLIEYCESLGRRLRNG